MQVRIYYRELYFSVVAKKIVFMRHFSSVQNKGHYQCHILHATCVPFSLKYHLSDRGVGVGVGFRGVGSGKKSQYRKYFCLIKMILLQVFFFIVKLKYFKCKASTESQKDSLWKI